MKYSKITFNTNIGVVVFENMTIAEAQAEMVQAQESGEWPLAWWVFVGEGLVY